MDDPDMESEIQEYSLSDQGGKMNWMLDKGLMLGKRALLTGIVISSAPFLLPPLVVFSALGLAFSVPSGLAIASYACTEKIMSKLLPMPNLPPMALTYKEEFSTDDEDDKMVYGGEIATRKEEEVMEDTRRGVGVRIQFVDECKEEWVEEKVMVWLDNLGPEYILNGEVVEPVAQLGVDHLVEESGYEEDVEDSLPEKDEQPLGDITMEVEESRDAKACRLVMVVGKSDSNAKEMEDGHPANNVRRVAVKVEKTDESVRRGETWIEETTIASITDEKELSVETTGLLERIRNENKSMKETGRHQRGITGGHQDQTGSDDNVEADKLIDVGFETMEEKQRPVVCERTTFVINASDCLAEDVPFDMGKENVVSSNADVREIADESDIMNEEEGEIETAALLGRIRHGNKSIEEAEQQEKVIPEGIGDLIGPDNDVEADKMIEVGFGADDFQGIVEDEQRPVVCDRTTLIIGGMDDNTYVAEDVPFDLGKENVISSNADKKEIANESDMANEDGLEAETTGLLEGIRYDNKSMVVAEHQEKGIAGGNQEKAGFDDNVEPEKRMDIGFETLDICSIIEEGQRPVVGARTMLVIGEMDANNCVAEDVTFESRKENMTSLNADTRGIADESGFDLFQDQNAAVEQFSHREVNVLTGSGDQKGKDFNLDFKVLPEKDNIVKPNEEQVLESEEKLWERIMAMRAIVGYRAPASKTCAEELKALYIFTGVEPPSSSKDPSDLMEVSSRLQFLMSIVGVK